MYVIVSVCLFFVKCDVDNYHNNLVVCRRLLTFQVSAAFDFSTHSIYLDVAYVANDFPKHPSRHSIRHGGIDGL